MNVNPNENIFVEVELVLETDKALLVMYKTEQIWLPKSKITYDDEKESGEMIEIGVPLWLARTKSMI